ncbi:RNA polymerase sigma-70 factor [Salipaludibacillus sp. HK11]|uniref:RNA polymerase sigma-70 factor n=1 Tax=Salipaludibacillus sp. HK11 TaxID=3394320 RepID=UPI0039FD7FEA
MQITSEEYMLYKPLLFSLGYRMLGSVVDAEDMMHETFLRVYRMENHGVENKKAYLCKTMTNICLDVLKSARYQREQYIGPWNPEPLMLEHSQEANPSESFLQKEGLSIAYLRMMEHLTPHERAVLLLREVFGFSYPEITHILEKTESNCRKIFSRSKQKLHAIENESLHYENNKALVNQFIQAFQVQDLTSLLELITENITLYSDGGGKVKAATRPIKTYSNVVTFLSNIVKNVPVDFSFEVKTVNGQPALVTHANNNIHSVISFYIIQDKINEIYIIINPDKLPRPQAL